MAVTVTSPDGIEWQVRRALLRGKDGHGRRIRWRAPNPEWLQLADLATIGDVSSLGGVAVAIGVFVLVVILLLVLPIIAVGLVQAVVLSVLFVLALVGATVFGRPILVRAEEPGRGTSIVWAVKGWGTSRAVRDQVVAALHSGVDPTQAVSADATLIARRDTLDDPT
jgi:membrane glycosyltransferase